MDLGSSRVASSATPTWWRARASACRWRSCPRRRAASCRGTPRSPRARRPRPAAAQWPVSRVSRCPAPPRPAHLVLAALYLRHGHISKHLVPGLGPPRPRPRLQRIVGLAGKLPGVEPLAPAVRAAHKLDTGLQGNRIHLVVVI